jgi:hypothetical protein
MKLSVRTSRALAALALLPAALAGCADKTTFSRTSSFEAAVVVNSVSRSLSMVPSDTTLRYSIGLGSEGTPVSVAAHDNIGVVPMGTYPFAAVVDLLNSKVYYAALPANSGATGAAFVNDSIVLIGNPNLNTVTPVNVQTRGAMPQIAVGTYPQAIVAGAKRIFVLNANLVNFTPAGHSSVTVFDSTLNKLGTVQLSGYNASAAAVSGTKLYVVNSGHYGQGDGSLSVVDIATLTESKHVTGFGEFPGSIAVGQNGKVLVGVYGTGILVWDPATGAFERNLLNPIKLPGVTSVAGLGFDVLGRLEVVDPGNCTDSGLLAVLSTDGTTLTNVATGVCPFAITFTRITQKEKVTL